MEYMDKHYAEQVTRRKGRPKNPPGVSKAQMTCHLQARITKEEKRRLEEFTEQHKVSASVAIRAFIAQLPVGNEGGERGIKITVNKLPMLVSVEDAVRLIHEAAEQLKG